MLPKEPLLMFNMLRHKQISPLSAFEFKELGNSVGVLGNNLFKKKKEEEEKNSD